MGLPIFLAIRTTPIAHLKQCIGSYHAAWKAAGHPGQGDVALIVPVYVAENARAARDEPEDSMMYFLRSIGDMLAKGTTNRVADGNRLLNVTYDEVLKELAVYGTPEAVADRLLELREDARLLEPVAVDELRRPGPARARHPVDASVRRARVPAALGARGRISNRGAARLCRAAEPGGLGGPPRAPHVNQSSGRATAGRPRLRVARRGDRAPTRTTRPNPTPGVTPSS